MGFRLYPTASWPRKVAGIVIRPMRLIKMRVLLDGIASARPLLRHKRLRH